MPASPHKALVAAPIPRPQALVASYVQRNTTSHKKMVWTFVAFGVVLWLIAGTADASGGHSGSVLASYGKALLYMAPLSMLILGPVLLFWSVNKSSLTRLLSQGQAVLARERTRDVVNIRNTQLVRVVTEFNDAVGSVAQARFEVPLVEAPPAGTQFVVLQGPGTTVAVLWPEHGAVMARRI